MSGRYRTRTCDLCRVKVKVANQKSNKNKAKQDGALECCPNGCPRFENEASRIWSVWRIVGGQFAERLTYGLDLRAAARWVEGWHSGGNIEPVAILPVH